MPSSTETATAVAAASAALRPDASSPSASGETTALTWQIHRLREEPKKIRLVAAGYAVALTLWWLVFPNPLALFLPIVALTSALAEFLFPIRYRLTTRGAYADCGPTIRSFIAWDDVRRATQGSEGIFLSPFAKESRLDSVRGIRLRFPNHSAPTEQMICDTVRVLRESALRCDAETNSGDGK